MKKIFTFFLLLVASVSAIYASDTQVDGIWYDFDNLSKTATVTYRGYFSSSYDGEYSGSVVIPSSVTYQGTTYSVTSIGKEAFYGCSSLTSVTIGESVTSIGDWAFYGCSSLTSVTIGESVIRIHDYAFADCSSLTSVTIPNSVTWIGDYTFADCSSLTSATLGESVKSIGYAAFSGCSSLTSVTIPNSVTSIGSSAFRNCSSLTSVTLTANSVKEFCYGTGNSLLLEGGLSCDRKIQIDGTDVVEITIPNSVTRIGDNAFYNCSSLTSVTIGKSVTSIGESAFYNCSSLTSVTIGESVKSIGGRAFYNCSSLTSVTIGESVKSIGDRAFYNCSSLTSVTIPNSVTSIGEWAFYNCSSLTSVTIGESVKSIGDRAFYNCSSLTKTNYTGDIAGWCNIKFGEETSNPICYSHNFYINDQEIKDLVIPNSVDSIHDYAFYRCSSLTSVTIGESVTSIHNYAFSVCSSLTSVTIGESVTSIGKYAFSSCSSLSSVTINSDAIVNKDYEYELNDDNPSGFNIGDIFGSQVTEYIIGESVTSIGAFAFGHCSKLTSVVIPNSVTSIGAYAFEDCSSLTKTYYTGDIAGWCNIGFDDGSANPIYYSHNLYINDQEIKDLVIPNSVKSIEDYAFLGCSSMTSVTIGESVKSIGDRAFACCSSLTSVTIPNSVTSIGVYAFGNCSSLTSVTIGESVTSIGGWAFAYCYSLTSVTIGESVKSIGDKAFYNCSSLTKTNYTGDIAGWCNIKFGKEPSNSICYSHNFYINDQEIKDLVIPNSVDSIHDDAFAYCSSLTSVTIGESVKSIGDWAFYNCSSLTSVTINSDAIVSEDYKYDDNISDIFGSQVTEYIIGNHVKGIGYNAFRDCLSLTSVTIGESVTSIGQSAFNDCSSLTSITCKAATPPTVDYHTFYNVSTSIPVYIPCGCIDAYKVTFGWKDFTNIQESLAEYSITVDVNDTIMGTAKVDYNTCEGNQISATPNIGYHFVQWSDGNTDNPRTLELTQDTILTAEFAQSFSGQCGDNLYWELVDTTLHITGSGEMYDYTSDSAPWKLLVSSIKVLTIAEDVTKIGYDAFDGCTALVTIVWNAKYAADAYNDGQYVYPIFSGIRSQITSFTFGEAVEYIPSYLCYGMEYLTSVTIPNSVASIGDYAFYNCSSLTSVTIPNSVTSIGYGAFRDCSSLTSITIPNSVTSIGDWAFGYCSTLSSITIPNSVTSIGYAAFACCSSLTSITIPNSVTSIGEWAFGYCYSLTSITCLAKTPPSLGGINTFEDVSRNIPVYVLCECVENYTFSAWSYFQNIVCLNDEPTGIENVDTHSPTSNCQKIIRNGQLLILRDGVEYTVMGQEL